MAWVWHDTCQEEKSNERRHNPQSRLFINVCVMCGLNCTVRTVSVRCVGSPGTELEFAL